MTDKEFKAGLLVGAAGALVLAIAFSGEEGNADTDWETYEKKGRSVSVEWDDDDYDRKGRKKRKSRNNRDVVRDVDDLDGFNQIVVKGGLELNVKVGDDFSVTLDGDDEAIEEVEFSVENGVLIIDVDDSRHYNDDDFDLEIDITMPELNRFRVDGAVDAEISGVDADEFDFEMRGAGAVDIEGKCGRLAAELRGAGDIELDDLHCKDVEVTLKGVGQITVYASESVDARLAGLGSIEVLGSPTKVKKRNGGLGEISID